MHLSIGQEATRGGHLRAAERRRLDHLDASRPRPLHRQRRRRQAHVRRVSRHARPDIATAAAVRCISPIPPRATSARTASSAAASRSPSARRSPPRSAETGAVVVCFFGDGANNEGAFHESLNMASVWKLPVVFVCENNNYGDVDVGRTIDCGQGRGAARGRLCDAGRRSSTATISPRSPRRRFRRSERAERGDGPTSDRMQDLSHPRPLAQRPESLSDQGRNRGVGSARSDSVSRDRTRGAWPGEPRGDRGDPGAGRRRDRQGRRVRRGEPGALGRRISCATFTQSGKGADYDCGGS